MTPPEPGPGHNCSHNHGDRPEAPAGSSIGERWDCPVWSLAKLGDLNLSPAEIERHQIYMGLLMAIIRSYWNGLKHGRYGEYPLNGRPEPGFPYEYKGHNIASLAVDRNGRVLDFDFNHNKLFNSSAEHAEARLVRRIFALAQIADLYDEIQTEPPVKRGEYDLLSEVTIYTSLESCAQCAGAMALGNVKQVVYLQTDPGMYLIGNLLHNLSGDKPKAPRPVTAKDIEFDDYSVRLNVAFAEFRERVTSKPFFEPDPQAHRARNRPPWDSGSYSRPKLDDNPSISSFLCTAPARKIFEEGGQRWWDLARNPASLTRPDEVARDGDGNEIPGSLNNRQALANAKRFLEYAQTNGRRGTPHRA